MVNVRNLSLPKVIYMEIWLLVIDIYVILMCVDNLSVSYYTLSSSFLLFFFSPSFPPVFLPSLSSFLPSFQVGSTSLPTFSVPPFIPAELKKKNTHPFFLFLVAYVFSGIYFTVRISGGVFYLQYVSWWYSWSDFWEVSSE